MFCKNCLFYTRRLLTRASIIVLILFLLAYTPRPSLALQADCLNGLDRFMLEENLIDPILMTSGEVWEKLRLYTDIYNCMDDAVMVIEEGLAAVNVLLQYYLIFVGGDQTPAGESEFRMVSLNTSSDPAIQLIRDEAHVPPPPGYIFLRFYSSREAMPPLVRRAFEDPTVTGVTILSRYIAILVEDHEEGAARSIQQDRLPLTISHELVHAYVNSLLGAQNYGRLPDWYSEGLAIHLSGSNRIHTVVGLDGDTLTVSSPAEYQKYAYIFEYLEEWHTRQQLLRLIAQSLLTANPAALYSGLNFRNYEDLAREAENWKAEKIRRDILRDIVIVVIVILAVIILLRGLFKLIPRPQVVSDSIFLSESDSYDDIPNLE
jgi:hypothetical protein